MATVLKLINQTYDVKGITDIFRKMLGSHEVMSARICCGSTWSNTIRTEAEIKLRRSSKKPFVDRRPKVQDPVHRSNPYVLLGLATTQCQRHAQHLAYH